MLSAGTLYPEAGIRRILPPQRRGKMLGAQPRTFAASLILPNLDSSIPESISPTAIDGQRAAQLALHLDQLGHIRTEDWEFASRDPMQNFTQALLGRAMENWVKAATGPLRVLRFDMGLSASGEIISDLFPELSNDPEWWQGKIALLAMEAGTPEEIFLEQPIRSLEEQVPGLGETVLSHLYRTLRDTLHAASPNEVLWMIQWLHWGGYETPEDWIAENFEVDTADSAAIEAIMEEEGLIRLSDFEEHVPKMAHSPESRLGRPELEALRDDPTKPSLFKEIAHLLLELGELENSWRFPNVTGKGVACLTYSCLLRWKEADHLLQHIDDHYNYWMQGGEGYLADIYGIEILDLDQPKPKITEQLANLTQGFRYMSLADQLLYLLKERA